MKIFRFNISHVLVALVFRFFFVISISIFVFTARQTENKDGTVGTLFLEKLFHSNVMTGGIDYHSKSLNIFISFCDINGTGLLG